MSVTTNYNFTSNYPISESAIRSLFTDTDDIASNYPMIKPKRILHDPEYFNRNVELVNDTVKRYFTEDVMRANEMFYRIGLNPTKIIFNPPATIVFWEDGTKTVVKCSAEDEFNEYYGFLAALGKKVYANNSQIKNLIEKKAEWHENKKNKKDIPDVSVDSLADAFEYLFNSACNWHDGNNKKED